MATNVKILGQYINVSLGTRAADLYAPASPKTALVSSIALTAGSGTPTVVLKAVGATAGTAIFHRSVLSTTVPSVVDGPITIGPGDKLTIQAATGTVSVKAVVTLAASGGQAIISKELTLALGESVEITVATNTVDCLLSGVERI